MHFSSIASIILCLVCLALSPRTSKSTLVVIWKVDRISPSCNISHIAPQTTRGHHVDLINGFPSICHLPLCSLHWTILWSFSSPSVVSTWYMAFNQKNSNAPKEMETRNHVSHILLLFTMQCCNVALLCIYVTKYCVFNVSAKCNFYWLGPLGRVSLVVAMSLCMYLCCHFPAKLFLLW